MDNIVYIYFVSWTAHITIKNKLRNANLHTFAKNQEPGIAPPIISFCSMRNTARRRAFHPLSTGYKCEDGNLDRNVKKRTNGSRYR